MAERTHGSKLGEDRISAALSVQRDAAPARPKRFFKVASYEERDGAFAILLDGRPAKTPAKRDLALPTRAAAEAVADEWNALRDVIDPAALPLTRIAHAAIDGVAGEADAVRAEVVKYIGSDLLLYRAGGPAQLAADQARAWDPILDWCRDAFGARFFLAQGVMPVRQPPGALASMETAVADVVGAGPGMPFRLAGLNVMTTLMGSGLLALAVVRGRLSAKEAWAAAHVDERFQETYWGQDLEAMARRQNRWREMQAAARLSALA